jgi:hypothetical protein
MPVVISGIAPGIAPAANGLATPEGLNGDVKLGRGGKGGEPGSGINGAPEGPSGGKGISVGDEPAGGAGGTVGFTAMRSLVGGTAVATNSSGVCFATGVAGVDGTETTGSVANESLRFNFSGAGSATTSAPLRSTRVSEGAGGVNRGGGIATGAGTGSAPDKVTGVVSRSAAPEADTGTAGAVEGVARLRRRGMTSCSSLIYEPYRE